jgi:hypothetical protein
MSNGLDMSTALDTLREWQEAVTETQAILDDNTAGRDQRIRAALTAGATVAQVVTATGLTRARVYQIRNT